MAALKVFVALLVCALCAVAVTARPSKQTIEVASVALETRSAPSNDLCETCVNLASQLINQLLNIILNGGVVGTCGALCGKVPNKALSTLCDLACDIVGIEEFIKIVQKADLDPIYYCEEVKLCPVNDYGDATITSFTSSPTTGPQGTTFTLEAIFNSNNGTGTGEFSLGISTVDGIPLGTGDFLPASKPGSYKITVTVNAKPDPSCDPSQGPCEQWLPGTYEAELAICEGECGSKHPHSKIYSTASTNFTLTQ